jgi:hypothetical protein
MTGSKKNIVWLASYPKSGNTWFRIFLSNLFSDSPHPVDINDLSETIISSNRSIIDSYLGIHSSELTAEEIDKLRPQVFRRFSDEMAETSYIKTHEAWARNSIGDPIFPEEITKGVIYIIRNPLDVAISYSYHNNKSIDETISALNNDSSKLCHKKDGVNLQTQQVLTSWSNHVNSWTADSDLPIHVIRFGDMLDHPLDTFRSAADFLDLNYEESQLLEAINKSSFNTLKEMEARDGFKERGINSRAFFRKGKSNEWESTLSKAQFTELVNCHKKIMDKFGYL